MKLPPLKLPLLGHTQSVVRNHLNDKFGWPLRYQVHIMLQSQMLSQLYNKLKHGPWGKLNETTIV